MKGIIVNILEVCEFIYKKVVKYYKGMFGLTF